jgi:hypothetical protein
MDTLSAFSKFRISKSQASKVRGGVTCYFSISFEDGESFSYEGSCAGSDPSECTGWTGEICSGWGAGGANQCNAVCYA